LVFLLQGLEALVFAGAGALFGTKIERNATAAATNDAKNAKADADSQRVLKDQALEKAQKGEALARLVKAKRASAAATGVQGARPGGAPQAGSSGEITALDELGELAEHFFPS
jgi:hypothetical protein